MVSSLSHLKEYLVLLYGKWDLKVAQQRLQDWTRTVRDIRMCEPEELKSIYFPINQNAFGCFCLIVLVFLNAFQTFA